jgi:hypothetical protein
MSLKQHFVAMAFITLVVLSLPVDLSIIWKETLFQMSVLCWAVGGWIAATILSRKSSIHQTSIIIILLSTSFIYSLFFNNSDALMYGAFIGVSLGIAFSEVVVVSHWRTNQSEQN